MIMAKKRTRALISNSLRLTLISILLGFIISGIILLIAGYNPFKIYEIIITGVFSKPKYISYTIIKSTPIIITGLAVAFAFRTGLFNIGAEGQFIVGSTVALLVGYFLKLPAIIHPIVVFLIAAIAGGLWGGIAGFLKAKFGIHEVISTIMLNWIAFYGQNAVINIPSVLERTNKSHPIQDTASLVFLESWKKSEEGKNWLINHPIIRDVFKTPMNYGFIVAILLVILAWFILNKTTLGYQLRAVGLNKYAAEYGGINVNKNIMTSMFLAGALGGSAGALQMMGEAKSLATLSAMEGYGFDGIAVALIGSNSPIGCLFSGLLFGILKYGGAKVQNPPVQAPKEIISIMIGTIILFIAMPRVIKLITHFRKKKRGEIDG